MTQDEIAALIPANVVEAAAKARYETMCRIVGMASPTFPSWHDLGDPLRANVLEEERASLAAGLAAWGGMETAGLNEHEGGWHQACHSGKLAIVLPIEEPKA